MRGPKVTVIGAGSYFFGKNVIHKMATSETMAGGTLALVDTNPDVLKTMIQLGERVFRETGCSVRLIGSTDRREVMRDSDFVVLTFSVRNAHYRGVDTRVAAKHGIRMCSGDTIGPGGIFRALREIPRALAMATDTAELAPNAWLINYVNPTAVIGIALKRHAPQVKSFALCDGHHEPHSTLWWCKQLGVVPREATHLEPDVQANLDLAIGGVNHCTWMVRFRYAGQDLMPELRRVLAGWAANEQEAPSAKAKPRYNHTYALQLLDLYGAYPTAPSHTKEYVPFFQGYGVQPNQPEPIRLFDAENRAVEMAAAWQVTAEYAAGTRSVVSFLAEVKDDHATDIIDSMWSGRNQPFYINSWNKGAITNLPADAFVELRSDLDMHGPRPQPFGDMPRGVLALQHQVLDAHELTVAAAMSCDRTILRRAFLTDPICNNIPDADACIAELLAAEKDALPDGWYR